MIELKVDIEGADVPRWIRTLARDQLPFATSRAINDVALFGQTRQREHQRSIFEVRNTRFVDRAVKIKPFSTKRRLEARVWIDPPGGQSRADILTKFETDRVKRPRSGTRLAIPIDAKRTKTGRVSARDRLPKREAWTVWGQGPKAKVLRGPRRRFALLMPGGRGFVFRRVGRGRGSSVELEHVFRPLVPIEPELNFERNITDVVNRRFNEAFRRRFDESLRTAA